MLYSYESLLLLSFYSGCQEPNPSVVRVFLPACGGERPQSRMIEKKVSEGIVQAVIPKTMTKLPNPPEKKSRSSPGQALRKKPPTLALRPLSSSTHSSPNGFTVTQAPTVIHFPNVILSKVRQQPNAVEGPGVPVRPQRPEEVSCHDRNPRPAGTAVV